MYTDQECSKIRPGLISPTTVKDDLVGEISFTPKKNKTILLGIPTAKYIESETFKSIYDLEVPDGYDMTFQYFYGYTIDQIRNLIAHWASRYDYLFSVDSDIVLPKDSLKKMLSYDKDIVSGIYIQRKPETEIIEIYGIDDSGAMKNIPFDLIRKPGLYEVAGCGFGCALIKSHVLNTVGYPQFEYHSALTMEGTVSEDTDFCIKAKAKGFHIFADSSIICDHIGNTVYKPKEIASVKATDSKETIDEALRTLSAKRPIPPSHQEYLQTMKGTGVEPAIIYDVGSCVLHWKHIAEEVWPTAQFILFDGSTSVETLYKENKERYFIGVLSDTVGKEVTFYDNPARPGGSTYYKENLQYSPEADTLYSPTVRTTDTLDNLILKKKLPWPDLIKMDVQGAELDVVKGASNALKHCKHLILELQKVVFNTGAPLAPEVIEYLKSINYELVTPLFSDNGPDGDYHFRNTSV